MLHDTWVNWVRHSWNETLVYCCDTKLNSSTLSWEACHLTSTESTVSQVKHDVNANLFWLKEYWSFGICSFDQTVNQHYLLEVSWDLMQQSDKNIQSNGGTRTGWFIMTMHQHTLLCTVAIFGHYKHGWGSPTICTHLIWPCVISYCLWEWNCSY